MPTSPERVSTPATLVYDGDCGFCTITARFVADRTGDDVSVEPWQALDLDALGLTVDVVSSAAYWVDQSGRTRGAHLAAASALRAMGRPWSLVGWLIERRPLSWLASILYRVVAANRYRLPGSTDACKLPEQ